MKARVNREFEKIKETGNRFKIEVIDKNEPFKWKAVFLGPSGTPYSNGNYILNIDLGSSYPFSPPIIKFINPPYCLNVRGHNDYNDDNKHNSFGTIKSSLLSMSWSPSLNIDTVLSQLYDKCFYECGYDKEITINNLHESSEHAIYSNKYKEYFFRPRLFLNKISEYNQLYGNGDKSVYYQLPQINEMEYFKNISIIDNILRDNYNCNETVIEIIFSFYGDKLSFCGLTNSKFILPPFNGIEDNLLSDMDIINKKIVKTVKWRSIDEIKTDIDNAKKNGKTFTMYIKAPLGGGRTLTFDACDSLTIADIKTIYHNKEGFPKQRARYIFNSKALDDRQQLSYYEMKEESTVYALIRMRGG